jgi:endonuclease-8
MTRFYHRSDVVQQSDDMLPSSLQDAHVLQTGAQTMPEGPEIRLAADAVGAAIAGYPAKELFFAFDRLKHYETELAGQQIVRVRSRSKAMLIEFEGGLTIYSHNQLYGKWMVRDAYTYPETNRQLRLAIHNSRKSALLYSASAIEVLTPGDVETHPYLAKLGPELLDEEVTVDEVAAQFYDTRFRRRRLTTLLLDQSFLAGLGNYLRSEILFEACVHPSLRPVDCTDEQIVALADAALTLTRRSYATRGITTDLALAEKLKAQGVPRQQYRWWVFGREDAPCYVCGTPIVKETLGGRRLYFCPSCQHNSAE